MKSILTSLAGASIATIALATTAPALAQDAPATADDSIQTAADVVVQGAIAYRNRSESAEPELVYDQDFFQRFEPLTAGDALKRVPSVTFLSDVIESDGARLRGLDPGYTQILINGEKVPGTNADRSFFLDRIPAELIKQVEIVRSSSARRTGDAVAGTLNIVLRDGYQLDGGYVRAGALFFDDGKRKPSFGAVFGGQVGPGRLLIGGNIQGRYNPKEKLSVRFDKPGGTFQNREDQSDVRDGTDYTINASYDIRGETTDFELSGFWVRTDRLETERSFEYNAANGIYGPVPGANPTVPGLLVDNSNINNIDQRNFSINGKLAHRWAAGETKLKLGYAEFIDAQWETENEIEFNRASPRFTGDRFDTDIVDKEFSAGLEHAVEASKGIEVVFGAFYQNKDRDTDIQEATRQRFNLPAGTRVWNTSSNTPDQFAAGFVGFAPITGGLSTIKEERKDAFALVEGKTGAIKWEVGVRYETTNVSIDDLTPGGLNIDTDYEHLLPSASAKIQLGDGRITISGARTVRRPRFDYITPITLEEELGDNDLRGNPLLKPEKAWGVDLGYERRLGRTGVIGVNVFYRDVKDLVEIFNTREYGTATDLGNPADPTDDEITWVYQPRNTGDGKVYGVEFDLSTSLGFLGLPDTGIFGNLSLLDSEITDPELGKRRFNGQSNIVYNFGFIQNVPSFGAAIGATYRKQGSAYDRIVAEEVTTTYGADLEIFVEKRFGKAFTIRAVGSNLLDGAKKEVFNKFNTFEEQKARVFDEYELESETAGPVFQVMARLAF